MTQTAAQLGSAPPRSLDSVAAGLVRLRRLWDMDEEERSSIGMGVFQHPDIIRVRLIDELLEWLKPAVEEERAEWDRLDRIDAMAKAARWPG